MLRRVRSKIREISEMTMIFICFDYRPKDRLLS